MKKNEAWQKVEIARTPERKTSLDYIEKIFFCQYFIIKNIFSNFIIMALHFYDIL